MGKRSGDKDAVDFSILKPPGSYIDRITEFDDLLRSMDEAEKAANELLRKTEKPKAATSALSEPQNEKDCDPAPTFEELMAQLDGLVGLDKIKENVRSLVNLVKVRKLRAAENLPLAPVSLHLVFAGNPGTGKTTVARLIAGLYRAIGVLSKGQLVEVDRSGLVAGFVGQTAQKTAEVIKSALGGVLFIDEAYALAPQSSSGGDFGREAIETILKAMEDHREDFVVIVAGYEELMNRFISSNPGLESRFNRYFLFEDYTSEELYKIFVSMCEKNGYKTDDGASEEVQHHLKYLYDTKDENFGNAREVRNLFENMVSAHSNRVADIPAPTKDELMTFIKDDVLNAVEL